MGVSTTASIRSFISSASHYGPANVLNMGHTNCIQYILFPEEFKVWKFLTFFLKSLKWFSQLFSSFLVDTWVVSNFCYYKPS